MHRQNGETIYNEAQNKHVEMQCSNSVTWMQKNLRDIAAPSRHAICHIKTINAKLRLQMFIQQ